MQVRVASWSALADAEKRRLIARSELDITDVLPQVRAIIDRVKAEGDAAVAAFTLQFDKADIAKLPLRVSRAEIDDAARSLDPRVKDAIRFCADNVRRYHEEQRPGPMTFAEVLPGAWSGERATPIGAVGLYAPRGKGSFPSSTYMLTVPASVAGVPRIVLVTPPDREGRCDPATLYAADFCGAHEIYRVGGVQALAALAYGTKSIAAVDKFVGPGNQYVTAAKRLLVGVVDVGLPAGPSESMIIADPDADPRLLALDLCIEAEHGPDSQALLVTPSQELASRVAGELPRIVESLPEPRRTYVATVLAGYGGIVVTRDLDEAVAVVNAVAPEHLQVAVRDPFALLGRITGAAEILLGQSTPFSLANYAIGANAVLPTGGKARTISPLSVRDFLKYSSVAYLAQAGYDALRDAAVTLADYEGFPAHAKALRERSSDGR
jgi:histidinol dehydrogenase